jgi:uncharacterized cupin superfamily protein
MSIIKYRTEALAAELGPGVAVAEPLGALIAIVRSKTIASQGQPTTQTGVWTCSPGRWVRQVASAEFCHFLSGQCVFEPEAGDPIPIGAGDALYFPENSRGTWNVISPCMKVFIVFYER